MSTPRLVRRNHAGSHSYRLDGHKVPGVTTVCGILDKPALVGWAANETAAYADEHWAELSEMRSADRIERMKKARFATNRKAVVRGNRVHALGERVAKGEQIPADDLPASLRPWVETYARFLDDWDMEVLHTETPVAHTDYRYAGTLDAIAYSPRLGTILLDIKTGKGVYEEVGLQLAAYRYANYAIASREVVGPRGGRKTVDEEIPLPTIDGCYVAHLRETAVEFHPVTADEDIWNVFLYLREVYDRWVQPTSWAARNDDDALRVIGDAIYPEDIPTPNRLEGEEA